MTKVPVQRLTRPLTGLLWFWALLCLSHEVASQHTEENGWDLAKERNGIKIYLRDRDDSPVKEFRAVGRVEGSMASIVALITDAEAAPDWYNHVKEGRVLEKPDALSHIAYTAMAVPWPLADRDMVSHFRYSVDSETGVVRMDVTSRPDRLPKEGKVIRITKIEGYWLLTPVAADTVEVLYQFFADPGGSIPGWMTNIFIVEDPLTALENMRAFVQKPKYRDASVPFLR